MRTRLTDTLGIETPIVCGGMMRIGTADLAAAVSNAGMVTVGMCGGLINDIPTCQQLVQQIVGDAEQIVGDRLASIFDNGETAASAAA